MGSPEYVQSSTPSFHNLHIEACMHAYMHMHMYMYTVHLRIYVYQIDVCVYLRVLVGNPVHPKP